MTRLAAHVPVRLPQIREGHIVTTTRPMNMEALIGQMVGSEHVADPTAGSGVWTECITVDGMFTGSCANCYYSSEGTRCSFRK